MKKLFTLTLILILAFSFTACGMKNPQSPSDPNGLTSTPDDNNGSSADTEDKTEDKTDTPTDPDGDGEQKPEHSHEYASIVTKAATCGVDGISTFTCSCGDSYTEKIPATGDHNYTSAVTKAATCTVKGIKTFTCACGDTYTETIDAAGHSFGKWKTTRNATAVKTGISTRACSKCPETETKTIPMLPNHYSDDEFVSRLEENKINVLPLEVYFEDGKLLVRACLANNTNTPVTGLSVTKMAVYDKNGKKIAEGTFGAQNISLGAYKYDTHTYRFVESDIVSYEVDLSYVYTKTTVNK